MIVLFFLFLQLYLYLSSYRTIIIYIKCTIIKFVIIAKYKINIPFSLLNHNFRFKNNFYYRKYIFIKKNAWVNCYPSINMY